MAVDDIFEGFSLQGVNILDGTVSALEAASTVGQDVYGVRDASLAPDLGSFDNTGDDAILSTWNWLNFATINVVGGFISFPVLAAITGQAISSSGSGNAVRYQMDLWHEDAMNPAPRPVLVRVPSRDDQGQARRIDFVLYKVQFGPMTFTGPTYKTGIEVTYSARALMSNLDETSTALADGRKRIGRIVSGVPLA